MFSNANQLVFKFLQKYGFGDKYFKINNFISMCKQNKHLIFWTQMRQK